EVESMSKLFGSRDDLYFNQSPQDKLDHVQSIQKSGKKVMMIGDGLNDAGALKQSDVGLVLADDVNNFTPASDVILDAKYFNRLSSLFNYSRLIKYALYGGFFLAALYNTIGLFFAVTAQLSPIVAAILMPVSSISIILYGVGMSKLMENVVFIKPD
ncbi:MAG: HAD family hydrolase, partial [Saprospiraceae bacterium]|nr:HAD family hydrolase [Saprospiraceae bacterium]